jgi:hypothetical protein
LIAHVLHLQEASRRETCSHLGCSFGAEIGRQRFRMISEGPESGYI